MSYKKTRLESFLSSSNLESNKDIYDQIFIYILFSDDDFEMTAFEQGYNSWDNAYNTEQYQTSLSPTFPNYDTLRTIGSLMDYKNSDTSKKTGY